MPKIEIEFQLLEEDLTRELTRIRIPASCLIDTRIIDINSTSSDGISYVAAHGCAGGIRHHSPFVQHLREIFRNIQTRQRQLIHFLLGDNVYDHGCQSQEGADLWEHFVEIYGQRTGAGTVDFPWHRCFGVLGNHDYNLINPFIRTFSFYGRLYGPRVAYNQIIQNYRLLRTIEPLTAPSSPAISPTALPAHFLPARYYAVNDSHAFYFCLDTNVLLFNKSQQLWFQQTLDRVQNTPELRNKFLIVVCHQPLQTFGKRSSGNGDSNYYFNYLTDPVDKADLVRFIHELIPYTEKPDPTRAASPEPRRNLPLSILLRRYIEREFSRRHLRIAVVMSAHDHFNECSFISTVTLQVIAGSAGLLTKDSQTDQSDTLSFQIFHTDSHAARSDYMSSSSSADAMICSMKWPYEMLLSGERERLRTPPDSRLTVPPPPTQERLILTTRDRLFHEEPQDDQTTLPHLNASIRTQLDLPLLAISPDRIDISWQTPETPALQLRNPISLSYELSLNRALYKDILGNIWSLNNKFIYYAQKPISRKILFVSLPGAPKHIEEINSRFSILFDRLNSNSYFTEIPNTVVEYISIITGIHADLTELIQITSRALGTRSYFRSGETDSFYKSLHFHFLNIWCTCSTFIEFLSSYPRAPALAAGAAV